MRADAVAAHTAGEVREDLVAVLELHAEAGAGQRLGDGSFEHDRIGLGLGHVPPRFGGGTGL